MSFWGCGVKLWHMSWLSKSALTQNNKLFNIGFNFIIFFKWAVYHQVLKWISFKSPCLQRKRGKGSVSLDRLYDSLCQSNPTSEGNKEICISKLCITTPRLFISYLWAVYFEVFISQCAETWGSLAWNHTQASNLWNARWAD